MNFSVFFVFVVVVCSLLSDQTHAKKRGCRCPHLEADGVLEQTLQKCWRSSECPSGFKCCRVGNEKRCVKPEIVDLDDIQHWKTERKDITDDEIEPEGQSQLKEGVNDRHDDRDDDDNDYKKSKHKWHIIKKVGCLIVIALAVIIVVVMAVCCMRRRQLRRQLMMRRQLQYQNLHQQPQQDVAKVSKLNDLNVISASDLNKEALKMSLGLDYTPATLSAPPSYEQLYKEKEHA